MQEPAVIVLLVHNAESRLERLVERVFQASEEVVCQTSVVIVDDGSRDETYEIACELAVVYPQLSVMRQPQQIGVGGALERVRQAVSAKRAIVYDGSSPLEPGELASLLQESKPDAEREASRGSRHFAAVSQLNDALERAHRPLTSFRWLPLESDSYWSQTPPSSDAPLVTAGSDSLAVR